MGFYLRKSVSVGPFRFNFSNSGIGVSAGIRGFRVGTGPRGNHITVGRGGLYYRATVPTTQPRLSNEPTRSPNTTSLPVPGVGPMVAIESAPVSAMQDSSSADLLSELNGKTKRPNYWKWTAGAGLIVFWLVQQQGSAVATILAAIGIAILTIYVGVRDSVAKTTILCYQLDAPNEQAFDVLHAAFNTLSSCRKVWRIDTQGAVHDRKYHAGASSLVTRKDATFGKGLPSKVKCNLEVPFVKAGAMALYFMPDRVLFYSDAGVGAVAYSELQFNGAPKRFIESDGVPGDAEVVDRTWKYVNKKGGPDRRFKNNMELPVALYEELHFHSTSGLNEVFQISRHSLSERLAKALSSMALELPT